MYQRKIQHLLPTIGLSALWSRGDLNHRGRCCCSGGKLSTIRVAFRDAFHPWSLTVGFCHYTSRAARVVELADTHDLKSCSHGSAGSTPASGTPQEPGR